MPILAIATNDYADEFDCKCFKVFPSGDSYAKWLSDVEYLFEQRGEIEFYFGTNEFLEFSNFQDFVRNIEAQEITQDEHDSMLALFNRRSFGTGNIFDIETLVRED